ncbi:MAG: response regulator [Verrucomicrobiales bacterium]|nr:response regulator [Verrucomicrobiales bacterium]
MESKLQTVLVIDDDPLVHRLIERSLQGQAVIRTEFAVPEEGVLALDGVDLVFLDYQLPVRNGLEILQEIREKYPQLPVVFLTGFGEPELADGAIQRGASLFLTKPVGPSRIQEVFHRFLPSEQGSGNERRASEPVAEDVDELSRSDRKFSAKLPDGSRAEGRLSRFGYRSAFVEFPVSSPIAEGGFLSDLRFRFGDQILFSGEGSVGIMVSSSLGTNEVEIRIRGAWRVEVFEPNELGKAADALLSFSEPKQGEELKSEWDLLCPNYRLAVHDLAEVLSAVHKDASNYGMERGEMESSIESMKADSEFVAKTAEAYSEIFWSAVQRFEKAALAITDTDLKTLAKEFARRILFPHTLSSPFLSRVVERPIGVPGDYGMLGQILGNPLEGYTVYDRIVNAWILSCGAASAYRFRVGLLHREIVRTVRECSGAGRKSKVLSMASGVAYEIQRYVQEPDHAGEVDFTMVDFSQVTLQEAERQYASLGAYPEGVSVTMAQSSVIDLANQSRSTGSVLTEVMYEPDGDFDLVYCAGLFDYLSDRLIRKVIRYLHGRLRPGGRLVVSNFTVKNPIRSWMTYVMDWNLIYRSEEDFEKLVRESVPEGELRIETDDDGVEVYALVHR